MDTLYILFLLTFFGFPVIGIILYKYIKIEISRRIAVWCILFFAIHNILFSLGFSLKGDFIDYCIFSIEYLALCLAVFTTPKAKNVYSKVFNLLGIIAISIGTIIGLLGMTFLKLLYPNFKADKVFHFKSENRDYETRRYSDEFVTAANTMYIFETYRQFHYLPFEKKIDETSFSDTKTNLNISEQALQISIVVLGDKDQIVFESPNGKKFSKALE